MVNLLCTLDYGCHTFAYIYIYGSILDFQDFDAILPLNQYYRRIIPPSKRFVTMVINTNLSMGMG